MTTAATGATTATTDVVVVGSGAAGLSTALHAAGARVLLLTAGTLGTGSASSWAQGGIAAAVGPTDSPTAHAADTLAVGWRANDPAVVDLLTAAAPATVTWLDALGARFARDGATWVLGREAGHRHDRILHADGDATGREIVRALTAAVAAAPHVKVQEHTRAVALLVERGDVVGVLARTAPSGVDRRRVAHGGSAPDDGDGADEGDLVAIGAGAVVLATGGSAGAWRDTTNPPDSRGSGLVLAADAGAELVDLQYLQFHPTALDCGADPLPLLTEALRGAGAAIVDGRGRRILEAVHPDAELAPRDVVAREVWRRRAAGATVLLDLRHVAELSRRFPTAVAACRAHGLDPLTEPVPITPAAHYHMGGVAVDRSGATTLSGLHAAGEVACTGAHGANRLASNSLLEALVFGERVGASVGVAASPPRDRVARAVAEVDHRLLAAPDRATVGDIRSTLTTSVGVLRSDGGLRAALARFDRMAAAGAGGALAALGRMVAAAALAHRERRGAHWRADGEESAGSAPPRIVVTAGKRGTPNVDASARTPAMAGAS